MDKYEASNGVTIEFKEDPEGKRYLLGTVRRTCGELSGTLTHATGSEEGVAALREFFRAEEDERLGRWRWPENPDYVVYPDGTSRRVVRESDGSSLAVSLHDREVMTTYLDSYVGAARAYDDFHPEPKPWHDAKPGEVWLLTYVGEAGVPSVTSSSESGHVVFTAATEEANGTHEFSLLTDYITAGRRIYPEDAS